MKKLVGILLIVGSLFTACEPAPIEAKEVIRIEGFVLTDALGVQMGVIGTAGNDWKFLDWTQFAPAEQGYLNFPDNINMSNTVVTTMNDPIFFPNPFGNLCRIAFHANDSVKVKIAVVDSLGRIQQTHAFKIKGLQTLSFDFSDANLYPSGRSLRFYYSYSAAAQANFKAGYGDGKICRNISGPVTSCF